MNKDGTFTAKEVKELADFHKRHSVKKDEEEPMFPNTKKWTSKDLSEFAEWCSENEYLRIKGGNRWVQYKGGISEYQTSKLIEMWEIETGRRKS